jgi:hypothetical protein
MLLDVVGDELCILAHADYQRRAQSALEGVS